MEKLPHRLHSASWCRAIPKSVHKDRMQQNFDIFDFTLTPEEMTEIEALDSRESLFFSHYDPKTVEWFMSIL